MKAKNPAERFSPLAVTGLPFDTLMARVMRLPATKPKKGSKPSKKKGQ